MTLSETAMQATTTDWLWTRVRELEARLAQFEKVIVSTQSPHTLHVRRQDGTTERVESGLGVYVRNDLP